MAAGGKEKGGLGSPGPAPSLPSKKGSDRIYYQKNTPLPLFIPLPRFLLAGEYSVNAKLLYALLTGRTQLSQRSGWVSEEGFVYVIYTIQQMADDLGRSQRTVKTALKELEKAGLITRVRQGWNHANRIFVKIPDGVPLSSSSGGNSFPLDGQETSPPEGNPFPLDGQETSPCIGQNLPPSKNKQENKKRKEKERRERALDPYGEYKNVFLSSDELARLQTDYPYHFQEYIDRLSAYIEMNGRHYANHYAAIRKWIGEDHPEESQWEKGDTL